MTVVSADTRPLTWRLQHGDAITDIKTYESLEGYAAVRKVVKEMSPLDVQKVVKDANLRGRGGAGFPTGVKWSLIPMGADAGVKYLVCNLIFSLGINGNIIKMQSTGGEALCLIR